MREVGSRKSNAPWWILGILGVLTLVFIFPLVINRDNKGIRQPGVKGVSDVADEDKFGPGSAELLKDLGQNPDKYIDQRVNVTAEIEDIKTDNAFTLESPGLDINQDILVITPQSLRKEGDSTVSGDDKEKQYIYTDNDVLEVNGTVRKFNREELQNELAIDLSDNVYEAYEDKPVIIAQTVNKSQSQ